jgi:hypothetical protein
MIEELPAHKRNLFEIENARNLNPRELAATFVPTQSFWRLLSAKNHVVLGARGSGKTAIAKMLSHDHLAMLDDARAQSAIREQQFIGVYVPTRLEWVGALKNKPWQTEAQKEEFFQWRLNLSSCLALITTLESCLRNYCGDRGQQARAEVLLASALSEAWINEGEVDTLDTLRQHLQRIEYEKHVLIARSRATGDQSPSATGPGITFESDLFVPIKRGMTLAEKFLGLRPECTWLVCLDEAEFLEEVHHRIINSHMRAYSGNVFFKVTTMPYCHYTLATNTGVSLDVGHDFEYAYIDSDPVLFARSTGERSTIGTRFARTLFYKRLETSGLLSGRNIETAPDVSIASFLGRSNLLDEKSRLAPHEYLELIKKYCSPETVARSQRLISTPKFNSQIFRKIHGALLLRQAYDEFIGRSEPNIYSGATLAIRCGDANPRRLIRIFNALVLVEWGSIKRDRVLPHLSSKTQTRVLRKLSNSALVRVQSEPQCGKDLYDFLLKIGNYMHKAFHNSPLTTDEVTSISIDNNIAEKHWKLIQRSVELGLLYPNIGPEQRDEMPDRQGTFHLAFILAPHFFLLPRRGRSRNLTTVLGSLEHKEQMSLF